MGDEIDPCECLWNHELTMRRLISLLRQSQAYCTDGECFDDPSLSRPRSAADSFFMMFILMMFGVLMFAFRPRRTQIEDATKPSAANSQDRGGAPPPPPRI